MHSSITKKKKTGIQLLVEMSRWQLSYMFTWHLLYKRQRQATQKQVRSLGKMK